MDRDRQPENFESPDFNVQNWMNSFFATTIAESTKLPLGNFDLHDPAFDFSFPETILTVGISELGLCAQKTECALSECFQGVQNGLPDAQQELKSIQNGILTLHQNYIHHQSQASRGTCQMLARTNAVDEEKKKSYEKTMSALCNVRNALEQRFKLAKLAWDLKHRIEKVEPCLHELKQDIPHESIQNLLIDICSLQSDLEQLEQLNLKIIIHSNLSRKPCCLWINTLNQKIQHVAGVLYQICEERCLRAWTTGDVRANQQNIASIKELKRLESICVRYAKFSLSPLQLTWKTDSERNTAGVENIVRILSRNVHTTDIFIRNQVTQIQEMFSPSCCCEQVMNAVRIGIEHTVVDGLKGFISYTTKPISPVSIILIQKFCEVLSPLLSPPTSGGLTLNKACIVHDAFVSIWDQWYSKMESSWFEEKMSLFPWIKELRQNVTLGADRLEYILTVELPLSTQDLLQMIRDSLHRCVDISSGWLLPKWHSTVYAGMLKYFVTHCHDLREVILSAGQIAKKPNFQELLNKTSCHLVFCLLVSCEDLVDSVHTYFTETVLPTATSGLDRKDPFDITGSFPLFQCEGRTTQVQRIADSYRSALHEYIQMQIHRNESSNYVSLQGGDHPEASHLNPLKDLIKTLQCELVEMFCHAVFFSDGSHTASFDTEYHVCNERSMCTRVQSERNSNMPLGCSPPMSIASDVLLNVPRYIESLTGPANVSDARMHRIKQTLIHEILLDCIEWYLRWLRTFLASLESSWRNSKDIRIRAGTSSLLDLQLVLGQLAVDIDHFVHACSALSGNLPATVERLMRVQECLPNCSVFYSLDPRVGTSPSEKSDDPSDVHRAVEHLEQTVRWLSTPLRRD